MGRCRQLAARRRPPGQGSPAPAGGGAPNSELFEHATRSAAARARLVEARRASTEGPKSSSRSRSVKTASAALVTASAASCFRAELRLHRRLPPEQRAPPREQPVQPPQDQPEPPGISISRCCPRHPTMFRADVSRKRSVKNYPCDPSAKVRPDAGSHRLVKVRLAGGPAGSVAPA
jgi:hypothetical protein